jgi:hypothetical protein
MGCPLYDIQVLNLAEGKELKAEDHPVLWEFRDVFPEEVLGLPQKEISIFQSNSCLEQCQH